jgi:glycosyltransferase involved in cell wall biosynthesis
MMLTPPMQTPDSGYVAQLRRHPRNVWSRFRVALQRIEAGDFYVARQILEGMRHNPEISEDILSIYRSQLQAAERRAGAPAKFNIPADYTGAEDTRLLRPFRKLDAERTVPKPYPWAMALPGFTGAGNSTRFLQEAATALAGHFTPSINRVQVLISAPEGTQAQIIADLAALRFAGRIEATLFGQTDLAERPLPGGGRLTGCPHPLTSEGGLAEVGRHLRETDLVVFLSGPVRLDPMLLQRALQIVEISDRVVQPLIELPASEGFTTLFADEVHRARFNSRYPFREMAGLNLIIPARLLQEIGLPDPRLTNGLLAARELAYRAFVRGAWFHPLSVPQLPPGPAPTPAENEVYKALCPNHWDRKRDAWHEVPKVAVYIPAYNAAKYIERAVDSVLSQDVADLEVCIANDGSRDGTLALLQQRYGDERRVRVLDNPNGGIGFASNSAIRMSNSLYIGQLDSDDCLKPGAVRRLMEVLDENPALACAYGSCERIDAKGDYLQDEYAWPVFSREKMMITSIAHHFRMFRRQAWERTSRFREDIVNGVDYDIFLKMSEVGQFRHIEEKLYQRRWHGENTSHVNEHHQTANTWRVQREALRRQGLSRFWDVHVPDPEKPRAVSYRRREGCPMVIFWPDYSQGNPYQRLLYAGADAEFVAGDIDAALQALASGTVRPADLVFHLHWLNALFRNTKTEDAARTLADAFVIKLERLRAAGARLIWTIHNSLSHDTPFPHIEVDLSARIAQLADVIHLHSAGSAEEVARHFAVPRDKVRVARHGHYIGAYPDFIDRDQARAALGIGAEDDVILFTGLVRPYKGVENLVSAFRNILAERPRARLLIAGQQWFDPLESPGLTAAERARILTTNRFVENGELQLFFRAADIAAYPYQNILTSGSVLLALSFGVPVVVPRVAMTADVLEGAEAGALYDGDGGQEALEAALRGLLAQKDSGQLALAAQNARRRAESQGWTDFAAVLA